MSSTLASSLRRERRLPYVYLAPSLIVLGVFGLLPVLFTAFMSLMRWDSIQGFETATFGWLSNFIWIFGADQMFGFSLFNTLWHALVSGVLIHASAIPLAVFIDQAFRRWRPTVMALYFVPYLTGGVVIYIMLTTAFSGSEHGLVNSIVMSLGKLEVLGLRPLSLVFPVERTTWFPDHADALIVGVTWWHQLGWNALLYVTALQYVPKVLMEAARIDGASAGQTLRHVIVPQLRPMIFFAATLQVVASFSAGGWRTLAGYMGEMAYGQGDFGAAAAMAVVVLAVLGVVTYLLWWLVGGRPALPRTRTPGAVVDDAPRRVTWTRRAWDALGRRLAAPESRDPTALRGFNGLRAIACLLVIYHHLAQRLDYHWTTPWITWPLFDLGWRSDMGVAIFFVLSGALLTMPFWQRFLDGREAPPLGDYFLRRAARIIPGYWAVLGVTTLVGLHAIPEAKFVLRRLVAGATFVSGLHYTTLFPSELDPVLWSISFEVLCYFLLPLLLLPMWRLLPDRSPQRAARYLLWVLVGLQVAHLAICATFWFPMDDPERGWHKGLIGGAKEWLPYWSPASFMTQFLLGGAAALAIAWKQRANPRRSTDLDWVATVIFIAAWALYALFGSGVNLFTRQPYITPVFPALVAAGLVAMQFGDRLGRLLDNRLFNWVAEHSFGLYLWHFPILELLRVYWVPTFKPSELRSFPLWLLLSLITVVGATALAWASWIVLERPALRWARRRTQRAPEPPPRPYAPPPAPAIRRAARARRPRLGYAFAVGGGILMLVPLYLLFVMATHTQQELTGLHTPLWFGGALLTNVQELGQRLPYFWQNLWMSVRVAGTTALLQILLCSVAGYAFAMLEFKGKDLLFGVLLSTLLLPGFVGMIPHRMLVGWLSLNDTARGLVVPAAASALGIFLMRQYIEKAVSRELIEAAKLDGCSTTGIYWRIVLPAVHPALAALALIAFIGSWNDYGAQLMTLHDMKVYTAPLALDALVGTGGPPPLGPLFAGAALSMVPVFAVFALCARKLFQSLVIDSNAGL